MQHATGLGVPANYIETKRRLPRSRVTTDPMFMTGLRKDSSLGRRRGDLVQIFLSALGGAVSDLQLVQIRKASELTAAAEAVRARVLAGESADLAGLVKLEGEARRATRELGIVKGPAAYIPLRDRIAAEEAESSAEIA